MSQIASECSDSSASACAPASASSSASSTPSVPASRHSRRSATGCWRRPVSSPLDQLGTTDDCGFAPFSDDRSTSRSTAFAKIRARVIGTEMAAEALGLP